MRMAWGIQISSYLDRQNDGKEGRGPRLVFQHYRLLSGHIQILLEEVIEENNYYVHCEALL